MSRPLRRRVCYLLLITSSLSMGPLMAAAKIHRTAAVPAALEQELTLNAGETVSLSARIDRPSTLPTNGRLTATWTLIRTDTPELVPRPGKTARPKNDLGLATVPTPNWSKLLHALDPDVFLVYRAPVTGTYRLSVAPEEGDVTLFTGPRWRESGKVTASRPVPRRVAWPRGHTVDVSIAIDPVDARPSADRLFIEAEPNNTPEQAQPLALRKASGDYTLQVIGGSDDIEYFDNGRVGSSGDDWFRLDFPGTVPRLLTACLSIPDQQVAARIRCYTLPVGSATAQPGSLLPLTREYTEGKNSNERVHQQEEQHQ